MSPIPQSPTPSYATLDPASSSGVLLDRRDNKEPDSDVISLSESLGSDKTELADVVDIDIDADTVLATLDSLLDLQQRVVAGLRRLHDAGSQNIIDVSKAEEEGDEDEDEVIAAATRNAEGLLQKSQDLLSAARENVVNGKIELRTATTYSNRSDNETDNPKDKQEDSNHVEIGAPLYKWASDAVVTLLDVQADVDQSVHLHEDTAGAHSHHDKEFGNDDESETESWADSMVLEDEPELVVTLHRHAEPLLRLEERAQDLLAVIRDITGPRQTLTPAPNPISSGANYCWRGPVFNSTGDGATGIQSRAQAYPKTQPETPYTLLRRELYALKDGLKNAIDYLLWDIQYSLPTTDWASNETVTQKRNCSNSVRKAYRVVEELLSNNGEDWLASARTRGMTFDKFQALDKDVLKSLRLRLECIPSSMGEIKSLGRSSCEDVNQIVAELMALLDVREKNEQTVDAVPKNKEEQPAALKDVEQKDDVDRIVERLAGLGDW